MKKITILVLLVFAVGVFMVPGAMSKTKSYYSGDAVAYNGSLAIASVNMGSFELFRLDPNNGFMVRMAKVNSFRHVYSGYDTYNSVALHVRDGRLYAFLTDGRDLYQYDCTDMSHPALIKELKDSSWDYFGAVKIVNGRVVTIGWKNIKVWNSDLQVIDSFNVGSTNFSGISFSDDGKYVFVVEDKTLKIFNTSTRTFTATAAMDNMESHMRSVYGDTSVNAIYVVDDRKIRNVTLAGDTAASFKHISYLGYDVDGIPGSGYIYFTDGVGVVKMNSAMKPVNWAFTGSLGGGNGWAMGLKSVATDSGDRVVVFNNSSILVMNGSMKLISYYQATDENDNPVENTYLRADKTRAPEGSLVSVSGGGFAPNENVEIKFDLSTWYARTDDNGRFTKVVTVPKVQPALKSQPVGRDIISTGLTSNIHYNLGFFIE